ncbi:glycosyl hydrolase family 18 protein [Paenibacillus glycanilyticus]|uniref:glycosyl hydrolase family 18 protein n=1 Tax=Paenibacillus glycanilyticus TaxID=126569 RepID=UPI00203EB77F|nr:glycosyl hydrolase family 18 protein [Paenibacillus glycanilyticus]MCM3627572.1 glycosyl hydrolase family 18 protein [Paenibacillus glycanilyticus]
MFKKLSAAILLLFVAQVIGASAISMAASPVSGTMTKYRVYQNDRALREFATDKQAIAYASSFEYSHVEAITGRAWVWDNFPKYKIYQGGASSMKWEYRTYNEALAAAKKMKGVHIRDLESPGWIYQSYPNYQLYQGDKTNASWGFTTLDAAKQEAKRWTNSHIIELGSNSWIWDNMTEATEKKLRSGSAIYSIKVDNVQVEGTKTYAFLYDAIKAAAAVPGSTVVNNASGLVVHSNVPTYDVQQSGKTIKSFVALQPALQYAKYFGNSEVKRDGATWWTSVPYLSVYQGDSKLKSFFTRSSAVAYAKGFSNSYVMNADGRKLWSNSKSLVYLAWNGSSNSQTILSQTANTQGLSIDSPSWFELKDSSGALTDLSDPSIVTTLKSQGIQVMPLVSNDFDKQMTTAFLADSKAQQLFISSLVAKLAALGVYGVNIDFEEIAGTDRDEYTAFVTAFSKAAHAKGLKVSIDLPRGDVAWDHLTAYDHASLAKAVDTIIIMAYDEHWSGSSTAGSVASLPWVEKGVQQFLAYGVPRSKLMLGIPFYVREWKIDGSGNLVSNRAVLMSAIPQLIADTNAVGVSDPATPGQTKYKYVKDGFTYVFWAENANTVQARINLAKKYDLAGVAAWRLGYETSDLWTMMLRLKQG